ncbi:MAG: thioredoxin domain-containing protein [Bacteriovoracaceae bacterium]|nr:thioredoxin domain-containing protein [Bacteriovoracaceae bacterium]
MGFTKILIICFSLVIISCQKKLPKYLALPGAENPEILLLEKFEKMKKQRGKSYRARTRHKDSKGGPKYTNRLFLETSPYLLQHAHNPVNWYPWGEEAFKKAAQKGLPVLLSVGYSTCHWCHVMEEESFEDEKIAKFINQNYVAIKVDREERPDVDAIYMAAVQAISGSGGWPMTVWLTPDKKPFYGATYIPARDGDRGVSAGFLTMLKHFKNIFDQDPEKVANSSKGLSEFITKRLEHTTSGGLPGTLPIHSAVSYYQKRFDSVNGGLTGKPKFPSSLSSRLLLRYYRRTKNSAYLDIVEKTLTKMAAGGMYDHVAGGFHRYSTDERWLVPHFEKMLYDNALLVVVYTEAFQVTHDSEYKRVAEEILDYVLKDMRSPGGGFYSATDADSIGPKGHREEGYYFTWTPSEIDGVLKKEQSTLVKEYYTVTSAGNFEGGRTILNTPKALSTISKKLGISASKARADINKARAELYSDRNRRPAPIRDDKIITAWNGLMISAFAQGSFVYNQKKYLEAAKAAASFILKNLIIDKRLYRSFKDNSARHNAYLDDYAFLIAGLIDLYEVSSESRWLNEAISLDQTVQKFYEDHSHGGFFMTSSDHEKLLAREKPGYDGAEPSGNSIQVMNLLRLHEFTTNDQYRKRAVAVFKAFSGTLTSNPLALSEMLLALDFYHDKAKEVIIVTPEKSDKTSSKMISILRASFLPNRIIAIVGEGGPLNKLASTIPLIGGKFAMEGKSTAYVCEKGVCLRPTTDPSIFKAQIEQTFKLKKAQ